jgi:uncharacterized RDD family membrane protein YckC
VLEIQPAGMGTRFLAALLDHLVLLGAVVLVMSLGLTTLEGAVLPAAAFFLIYPLWFAVPEALAGRTVGKATLDLRVIREDGQGVDVRGALIRNLVRLAYVFPPVYLIDLLVATLDTKGRRLGDILAGTLVVGGRPHIEPKELILAIPRRATPRHPKAVLDRIALTPREYAVLRAFCFRTRTLSLARRRSLASRILTPLHARGGLEMPPPESLEDLLVDLFHATNGSFDASHGAFEAVSPRHP